MNMVSPAAPVAGAPKLQRVADQPENPYAKLILDQDIAIVPSFTLESGVTLYNVPVAYTTRGRLSSTKDNALVICHALSGSADVADWWGPLMGESGRAFDATRFFIVCLNSLGSPYGSASPMTSKKGDIREGRYGPEFPLTTVRDDVSIHKIILDDLGIRQIAAVVGGSMGGMLTLEWAYFGKEYVRSIVPIATSARHSAWGISWGEAQRQSIYSDPKYEDGYYTFEDPPVTGLGAARMSALLTYRSRDSFEARFGRNQSNSSTRQPANGAQQRPSTPSEEHWSIHNDGHKSTRGSHTRSTHRNSTLSPGESQVNPTPTISSPPPAAFITDPQFSGTTEFAVPITTPQRSPPAHHYFSAQSYLRYQGSKFVRRFDPNCYIAITRKLDTHDVSRNRSTTVQEALQRIEQPALVLGIESDGLFTFAEQRELADGIPQGRLGKIDSPEGHDAFLLQFEQVNRYLVDFFNEVLPEIMQGPAINRTKNGSETGYDGMVGGVITNNSTFGEAEVEDLTAW